MNDYLLSERIPKNGTAAKALASLDWPATLHQKLIDKPYNKAFKALAPSPKTKLPKAAPLFIPLLPPAGLKAERTKIARLSKALKEVSASRKLLVKVISGWSRDRYKDEKKIAEFKAAAADYLRRADRIDTQCNDISPECRGRQLQRSVHLLAHRDLMKKARALERKWAKLPVDQRDLALKAMYQDLTKAGKEIKRIETELRAAEKLVMGLSRVMP
ncbi:hypothetical protein SAMN05444007_103195 [Cribrihabitans marinus]|uniref:Uncharacterized protein n=1 Tax=Cribrihabitans marinus TaxID=1227549 RepID=A0A1H6VI41_9RHOB|nr:hypothetical protein [Cribrihabitans marinus]GGH25704.1 hypothetical protein GCM10010973_13020 [Cribrihabitans marinus]SEJ04281.1 hypothetical protein SAMN05444007_103195 [Cribrihabitans marinus]